MTNHYWRLKNHRLTLYCQIQPSAKQTQILGLHNQQIKIQLQAPPVNGKANKALIVFLSNYLSHPKSDIRIIRGLSSRKKVVEITGVDNLPDKISLLN